jgi:dimethylpropiothetin dethiomethylase
MILGFVLFAPNTTYPQHSHADIEESYISLAGAWSENELAVYSPGSLILNRPGEEHRITTGRYDPCLLAYAWIGPDGRLAQPGMKFSRTRKRVEQGI